MDRWVLNASPLICLAKAGYSDLLLNLPDEVIVPQTVIEEIQAGLPGDPARLVLTTGKFPTVDAPSLPEILAWDLGRGETADVMQALQSSGLHLEGEVIRAALRQAVGEDW
jgi:predicted nucleic acid-binding protein